MKYMDLHPRICQELHLTPQESSGVNAAMRWMDMNPDQAPKIELSEHQLRDVASKLFYRWADLEVFTSYLQEALEEVGVKTLETPVEEKLADDIRQLDFEGALGSERLAKELVKRGWGKV